MRIATAAWPLQPVHCTACLHALHAVWLASMHCVIHVVIRTQLGGQLPTVDLEDLVLGASGHVTDMKHLAKDKGNEEDVMGGGLAAAAGAQLVDVGKTGVLPSMHLEVHDAWMLLAV